MLNRLARLFLDHRDRGLPFHADTSIDWARQQAEGATATELHDLLEVAWYGAGWQRGMIETPREAAYYGGEQALRSDTFQAVADEIHQALRAWLPGDPDSG
jgi:hypothetical protein